MTSKAGTPEPNGQPTAVGAILESLKGVTTSGNGDTNPSLHITVAGNGPQGPEDRAAHGATTGILKAALGHILAAALRYIALGWHILPVRSDKKPYIDDWQHKAFVDPELAERWWGGDHPVEHIGIATARSQLVVVDLDGTDGAASWAALRDEHGADEPKALTATTPRGRHLYFAAPPSAQIRTRAGVRRGMDVRGGWIDDAGEPQSSGYVVAPPGPGRVWLDCDVATLPEPPELPPWLLAVLAEEPPRPPAAPQAASEEGEDWATLLRDGVDEGRRNDTAARLAGHFLGHGHSAEETLALLVDWAARCRPPLPNDELQRVVASIASGDKRRHPERTADYADLILDAGAPLDSAMVFRHREAPHLLDLQGELLDYVGPHYADVETAGLRSRLYAFLDRAKQKCRKGPPQPFAPTRSKVDNVIDALRALAHRPRNATAPPCWLDGDGPPPLELVPVRNGLLHLRTGALLPPTPRFLCRHAVPIEYDATAPPPARFLAFLAELWDDDETVNCLRQWLGYLLTPDVALQKILLLLGPTRAGKGVLLRLISELVGPRNVASPSLGSIGDRFALQVLLGKSVATIADMRLDHRSNLAAIAENLLRISGGDIISVPRKYQEDWTGRLCTRFVVVSNELPDFRDRTGALAARIVPIVFHRSFAGREDLQLFETLRGELGGILRWAAEGWRMLQDRGAFSLSAASRIVVAQLGARTSPIRAFLAERCRLDPTASAPKAEVFGSWTRWCAEREMTPGAESWFAKELLAAFPGGVRSSRPRDGDDRVRMFEGLALVNP